MVYCWYTAAVADDISLPDPLQVVFSVGETESSGCINVPITSDTELEGDHDFTVTITSAGNTPHAMIGTPSVSIITIKDDERKEQLWNNSFDCVVNHVYA